MTGPIVFYYNLMCAVASALMLEEVGAVSIEPSIWKRTTQEAGVPGDQSNGKTPGTHRGITVTETAAICAYLADAFPAAGLAGAGRSCARYVSKALWRRLF
jgi:glutathione S-transferase